MEFDKLVVSFLVDEVVGGFFISVPPGHVACIYDRGYGVLKKTWGPGLHLKIPFWQVAKLFNAQTLEYSISEGFDLSKKEALGDQPVNATTSDKKNIQIEASILVRLNKNNAYEIWENIGEDFVSKVVRPISRSKIRAVLSEVSLDQITSYQPQIEKKIQQELNETFSPKGLICEGFLLAKVKYIGNPETIKDDHIVLNNQEINKKEE
jgi:regulator of protease activity HflC (stomatin/prohibitin superfamily)